MKNCRLTSGFVLRTSLLVGLVVVQALMVGDGRLIAGPLPVITSVPGSPFTVGGGANSNVILPSPDGRRLFVTNQDNSMLSVWNAGVSGALSFGATYVVPDTFSEAGIASMPTGLATNPAGTRLYVAVCENSVVVYDVNPATGGLTQFQVAPLDADGENCPAQGIVYVSASGGGASDYVYVNNGWAPNTVSRFQVQGDDSLSLLGPERTPTGGEAGGGGLFATPTARSMAACADGCHLFVVNGSTFGGSNDISVFTIGVDGLLTVVDGSPFALPIDEISSGALALSPDGHDLYAGTWDGDVVRFAVSEGVLSGGSVTSMGVAGAVNGLEVHPCGDFLAATFGPDPDDEKDTPVDKIAVLDARTMSLVGAATDGDGAEAAGLAFSRMGNLLFAGNAVSAGQQVSVYRFNAYGDVTAPTCRLTGTRPGPPTQIDVTVEDASSGLALVEVTIARNCTVTGQTSFALGTTAPVVITATKVNQSQRAQVELRVTDCAGNVTVCDPVIAEIKIPRGRNSVRRTFRDIPAHEHFITVENDAPGLRTMAFRINGKRLADASLADGEGYTADASTEMFRKRNNVTVLARGAPGSKALLIIGDASTSGAHLHTGATTGAANLEWGSR